MQFWKLGLFNLKIELINLKFVNVTHNVIIKHKKTKTRKIEIRKYNVDEFVSSGARRLVVGELVTFFQFALIGVHH